jgi:hypothetical protein
MNMRYVATQSFTPQWIIVMLKNESTPTRTRVVLEEAYAQAGQPNHTFTIPQPFTPEMIQGVAEVGANAAGVAQQLNQVLAENLSNNIASKVRNAAKAGQPLPTQADMDELYAAYDFSGSRSRTVTVGSLLDKIFARLAAGFIRKLVKRKGYKDLPAPVTVAKRGMEGPGQMSYSDFEFEVARLVEGEGPWSEVPEFVAVRESLIEEAQTEEATIRQRENETEGKLSSLGL